MVASEEIEVVWKLNLVTQQKANRFNALLPSVHIVTYKHKLLISAWIPGDLEKSEKVKILSVNITKNLDWSFYVQQHFFLCKNFSTLINQKLDGF